MSASNLGWPSISIIVPTLGRPSLQAAFDSIAKQPLGEHDEVLVIGDGDVSRITLKPQFRYIAHSKSHNDGDAERNFAIPQANGDYLVFVDDDNVMLPGSLSAIRELARKFPGHPLVFRHSSHTWPTIPQSPELLKGNIDTACGAWPNVPERLGKWGCCPCGDYYFARSTVDLYPNKDADIVWSKRPIGAFRPHLAVKA